jgi:hypothetical protein
MPRLGRREAIKRTRFLGEAVPDRDGLAHHVRFSGAPLLLLSYVVGEQRLDHGRKIFDAHNKGPLRTRRDQGLQPHQQTRGANALLVSFEPDETHPHAGEIAG